MGAIDIHTHAFPDALARQAVPRLESTGGITAHVDGTVGALLGSMDSAGVDCSVVASIATRPSQYDSIKRWSATIASDRLVPFPSVHPADPLAVERVHELATEGFLGIKLHPYYQEFVVDEDRMAPIYAALSDTGLVLLMHSGFDPAYPRDRIADPVRLAHVARTFPKLKLIATHIGSWEDWDEVERHLLGTRTYVDTAHSLPFMPAARARELLSAHPSDRILFGSDSPWSDQAEALDELRRLDLGEPWERAVFHDNAADLLGIQTRSTSKGKDEQHEHADQP